MGDIDHINMFFDRSGFIDKEKLQHVCPYLSSLETDTILNDFNKNHDNHICLGTLMQSNNYPQVLYTQNVTDHDNKTAENMTQKQINEIFNNLACQEQIYEFYETLRNGSGESVEQFQSILEVFVCDILKYRKDIKRLEDSYKREKETNEKYLTHIEEEQERDMLLLEEKVRQEERQKFDIERELILQRTSKEINDLQGNIQRLRTIEQVHTDRKNDEDSSIVLLREEIAKLTEENQTLNSSLNDSLTTNAIIQSDLQSLKTQLSERKTMLLQEKQSSSSNYREKESLQTNVRHLVEVNKQLRDENDSLRAIIDTNKPNASPPKNTFQSPKRFPSAAGSTLGSYWNNAKLDSPSPSYVTTSMKPRFESFEIDSADEKALPVAPVFLLTSTMDGNNTMNDSGLSLTTVRDPTEVESDHQLQQNKQILMKNIKKNQSFDAKRNKDDTDSDDVFVEISHERNHFKRSPQQQRSLRRANTTGRSRPNPSAAVTNSPALKTKAGLPIPNDQQSFQFDRMFKVVFAGDAAVGKSTLIMRLCKGKFVSNINSTLGVDFQNKQIEVDSKRIAIQLWDTAGQERFRSVAKSYFRRCDGVILVYDATYERSFVNVRDWISIITDATPKKVSVMIVANKIDLRDQMRTEGKRVIERAEGAKLAKEHKALFIEASAKDGTNADETLVELARDMQCNEDLERFRTTGVDLDKASRKSVCC